MDTMGSILASKSPIPGGTAATGATRENKMVVFEMSPAEVIQHKFAFVAPNQKKL